jgi:hypothetical protein
MTAIALNLELPFFTFSQDIRKAIYTRLSFLFFNMIWLQPRS